MASKAEEFIMRSWENIVNFDGLIIDSNIDTDTGLRYILFIDKSWKAHVKVDGEEMQTLAIIPAINQAILMLLHDKFQGVEFNEENADKFMESYHEKIEESSESKMDQLLLYQYLIARLNAIIEEMLDNVREEIVSGKLKGVNENGKI